MDAFDAYMMYNSLKRHFTDISYDYYKYHGKLKLSRKSFETKPFVFHFKKLSQKDNPEHLIVSNFIQDIKWINDLLSSEANQIYLDWKKRNQSLTYHFQQQLESLPNDIDLLLKFDGGDYPQLLKMYNQNCVTAETVVVLDFIFDFLRVWYKKTQDTIIMTDKIIKLIKYKPFITYNDVKIRPLLVDKFKR